MFERLLRDIHGESVLLIGTVCLQSESNIHAGLVKKVCYTKRTIMFCVLYSIISLIFQFTNILSLLFTENIIKVIQDGLLFD